MYVVNVGVKVVGMGISLVKLVMRPFVMEEGREKPLQMASMTFYRSTSTAGTRGSRKCPPAGPRRRQQSSM